jgi:hypothetical protein
LRVKLAVLFVLLLGCDDGVATIDTDLGSETATDSETETATDSETETEPPRTDEQIVRELIAGAGDLDLVMHEVAWSGGWPVKTDADTWIFVRRQVSDEAAFVAGDFDDWALVEMTRTSGFAYAEVAVSTPVGSKYKFVVDGTEYQADPTARSYWYDQFGEVSYIQAPSDAARLDRWPDLTAEGLPARDVRVLVPAGEGPWPVMYAHDGQNLFDPGAFFGGWHLQDTVSDLLIVGIDNTPDRMSEYTHVDDSIDGTLITSLGDRHADLLHKVVRPHVETIYGTTGINGVMGSSLGGLQALNTALRHDGYDFVASLSGTLGWGRFERSNVTMRERWLGVSTRSTVIYVDSGGSDGGDGCVDVDEDGAFEDDPNDSDNYCVTRKFADAMAGHGYVWDETLYHWHEPKAPHNESAWAARASRPLDIFLRLSD